MSGLRISEANTYFTVKVLDRNYKNVLKNYIARFLTYEISYEPRIRRYVNKPGKRYYAFVEGEYRFPINMLRDFLTFIKFNHINWQDLEVVKIPMHRASKITALVNPDFKLHNYQTRSVELLLDKEKTVQLVSLQTGKGKTLVSCAALCEMGQRVMVIILPMYIEKWIGDIMKNTDIAREEILVVKGKKHFNKMIKKGMQNKLSVKVIILSNTTVNLYLKEYEEKETTGKFEYIKKPQEITRVTKTGTILVDEVHQSFYAVYKASLYFNVNNFITLSATLRSNNKVMENQYRYFLPPTHRIQTLAYDKYINTFAVSYNLEDGRFVPLPKMYSHTAFENNILKVYDFNRNYFNMILEFTVEKYIKKKKPGQKLAIFAASKEMCSLLVVFLRNMLEDKSLSIERYIDEDPYVNVIEPDIRVTTVLSAGTAVDIPDLLMVFQTINILSIAANVQTYGRLRKLKDDEVEFYYFWCRNISKHVEYHKERTTMLGDISKKFTHISYNKKI